jgi:hypothetical protein
LDSSSGLAAGGVSVLFNCRRILSLSFKGLIMTERKVDVLNTAGKVLHTYPITIGASNASPKDADYEKEALSTAKTAKLVPDAEFASLTARMHVAASPHA